MINEGAPKKGAPGLVRAGGDTEKNFDLGGRAARTIRSFLAGLFGNVGA